MCVALAAAAVALLAARVRADATVVQTAQGPVQGAFADWPFDDVLAFKGIPFAEPPLGARRFQPPAPLRGTRSGTLAADKFGPACIQPKHSAFVETSMSEDCLQLNVWTPAKRGGQPLPVMVFFYGGGFGRGSTQFPVYSGDAFIANSGHRVVVVTVNYRLGPFGFLGSDELQKLTPDNSTGNYGLQDQREALKWLHANVANFGGDPKRITIWGESAGAGSVSTHFVMPRSGGLFARGIAESGPFAHWVAHNMSTGNDQYRMTLATTKCGGAPTPRARLACLQKAPVEVIQHAHDSVKGVYEDFGPLVDGVELPANPQLLAQAGRFSTPSAEMLLGTNLNEGTLIGQKLGVKYGMTWADVKTMVDKLHPGQLAADVYKLYYAHYANAGLGSEAAYWAAQAIVGDESMTCPAERSAAWLTRAHHSVHLYYYTHVLWVLHEFYPRLGVFHGSDLVMVWDVKTFTYDDIPIPLPLTPGERALQQVFTNYWASFAESGNPNSEHNEEDWPQWTNQTAISFELAEQLNYLPKNRAWACDFWAKHWQA